MPRSQRLISYLICFLWIVLTVSGVAAGQQLWSGVLAPTRAIDWTQAGVIGGIPTVATACGTQPTLLAGAGNAGANRTAINNAIAADKGGGSPCVINFAAGTWYLSGTIQLTYSGKANIVLRGAGSNQTFFIWNGATSSNCNGLGATAVCFYNGDGDPPLNNQVTWTPPSSPQGTTSITLSGHNNLFVGTTLILDQADSATDTGNIWACLTSGANGDCSQQGAAAGNRPGRNQFQNVTVTGCGTSTYGAACTSNTINFTPGLDAPNWNSAQSPGAYYSNQVPISFVGVENLSLDYSGISLKTGIAFQQSSTNMWVKGVRLINGTVGGQAATTSIMGWRASHVTVRDSYIYGSNPQSAGYGISPDESSANWLIENNICQHVASCVVYEGGTGSVVGYNYSVDNYFGSNYQQEEGYNHGAGDSFDLWEGNEGIGFVSDDIHGTHWMQTLFRGYYSGRDPATVPNGPYSSGTYGFLNMANSRYNQVIGSVLGTASYHTHYQDQSLSATDCSGTSGDASHSVFVLDFSDQNGTAFSPACQGTSFLVNNDALVSSTLVRWGNYTSCTGDSACNFVHFCTGKGTPANCPSDERAASAPVYPGLASPNTTLPQSFYLNAKPSWWGTMPWPAVGPDVVGGDIINVGGHAFHNPAALCYLSVMGGLTTGASGPLAFDSSNCYTSSSIPPPTGLSVTVH
jgi:hypothetical protein